MEQTKLKIAAIQMLSTPDWQRNLDIAENLIGQAAKNNAKFVILPEYFILITTPDDPKRLTIAEKLGEGKIQKRLAQIAQDYQIYLLAGTLTIKADNGDKFYNTSIIYTPGGAMLCHYNKIHLFKLDDGKYKYDEGVIFKAGDKITSAEIEGFRIGLSICYDLRFPELYRQMGVVDALVLPAAFTYLTGIAHWEVLCRARAIENQCYFAAIGQGGKHQCGRKTYGHSMIIDPWGKKISECELGEHIIYAELDKTVIHEVRTKLPALEHRQL